MKKIVMFGMVVSVATLLAYCWWRTGSVVIRKRFDGFIIQVRRIPDIPEGRTLSYPPGIASTAFIIEVGGNAPITTFRVNSTSEDCFPASITKVGDNVYRIDFSNSEQIGVRLHAGYHLAEWLRGNGIPKQERE